MVDVGHDTQIKYYSVQFAIVELVFIIIVSDKNSKLLSPHMMEMHLSGNSESEDALHVRKSIVYLLSQFVTELSIIILESDFSAWCHRHAPKLMSKTL